MLRIMSLLLLSLALLTGWQEVAVAQQPPDPSSASTAIDPNVVVSANSEKALSILKGPIAKVAGAVILLAGVAGLLRGHYQLAVSCAVAYVVLLFLNNAG